jgi:hypothetical protein
MIRVLDFKETSQKIQEIAMIDTLIPIEVIQRMSKGSIVRMVRVPCFKETTHIIQRMALFLWSVRQVIQRVSRAKRKVLREEFHINPVLDLKTRTNIEGFVRV